MLQLLRNTWNHEFTKYEHCETYTTNADKHFTWYPWQNWQNVIIDNINYDRHFITKPNKTVHISQIWTKQCIWKNTYLSKGLECCLICLISLVLFRKIFAQISQWNTSDEDLSIATWQLLCGLSLVPSSHWLLFLKVQHIRITLVNI